MKAGAGQKPAPVATSPGDDAPGQAGGSGKVPIIHVSGLTVEFPLDSGPLRVLNGVDLSIDDGEFVILMGRSGSGKSTLGLCLNGIVPHSMGKATGSVRVNGIHVEESTVAEMANHVGIVFQDPDSQLVNLWVRDEVAFGPENLMLPVEEIRERMAWAIDLTGIGHLRDRLVFELSGGQKQKVAIASVVAMQSQIVFFDDSTTNLDPRSAKEVVRIARELHERGRTVIVCETKIDDFLPEADRLVVLDDGKVMASGPPAEVLDAYGPVLVEKGLWLPQVAEVELRLRQAGHAPRPIQTSVEAAAVTYADLTFDAGPDRSGPTPGPSTTPAIVVSALEAHYGKTKVLHGIDLNISAGEMVAIVGPNGSGKTTLVKHFVGLLRPSAGKVEVFGADTRHVSTADLVRDVGFVFQYPEHQFVRDTVRSEIALSLQLQGVVAEEVDEQVAVMLRVFGLEGYENRHPFSLSGGLKRRLSVATVLVSRPRLIVLDEPTHGQDRASTESMISTIVDIIGNDAASAGATLVMVTHDMRFVAEHAKRVVALKDGLVVYDGGVGELFANSALMESVNIEEPPIRRLASMIRSSGISGADVPHTVNAFVRGVQPQVPAGARTVPSATAARSSLPMGS